MSREIVSDLLWSALFGVVVLVYVLAAYRRGLRSGNSRKSDLVSLGEAAGEMRPEFLVPVTMHQQGAARVMKTTGDLFVYYKSDNSVLELAITGKTIQGCDENLVLKCRSMGFDCTLVGRERNVRSHG